MKQKNFSYHPDQFVIHFDDDDEPLTEAAEQAPAPCQPEQREQPGGDPFQFLSFGSGSSGNCCYIGSSAGGVLVDAGIRDDYVRDTLFRYGILPENVRGILLTHDHADHVRYVYKLLRNNKHMRLFCTNRVMLGLLRRHGISKRIKDYHSPIFKEIPFKVGNLEIIPFDVPHDGTDNMGFSLMLNDRRFVIATDLGEVQERGRHYMSLANYLVVEANYDSDMLRLGSYPEYLKSRIRAEHGHMLNEDTARFVASIAGPQLQYVFLCHLSQDNNTPEKALTAVRRALEEKNVIVGGLDNTLEDRRADLCLGVLPRFEATRLFRLR